MRTEIKVVPGRGEQVKDAALERIDRGAVLETPEQFISLVKAATQQVRREQAWRDRRAS